MTLTRIIQSKQSNHPTFPPAEAAPPSEAGQILHLKRLLVTLKQHYEQSLHASQIQLQVEQNQRIAVEKELGALQAQIAESQKLHEEELQALINQQVSLKGVLKKTQEELEKAKKEDLSLETVVSTTSSHHLRQELEGIKRTLGQETKAVEARYVEILNEKVELEHKCKQLQQQLDHQSSNLSSFQGHLHQTEEQKMSLEDSLRAKEAELSISFQKIQEMQTRMQELEFKAKEKDFVQDKYEQLKDEWNQLGENLEEAVELRTQAEEQLMLVKETSAKLEVQLAELSQQMEMLQEEGKVLEAERDQLRVLLDESETRLKVAQQHLAKKVKESTLLTERVEEQQNSLADMDQTLEQQKTQIIQLQASVELYQRQEKRLQEQLHDALKGTESQVAKWEEKYFRMYDKLQESENKIRELKKFEEKHLQMQHFLSNFGNFMGNPFNAPLAGGAAIAQEPLERNSRPLPMESLIKEEPSAQNTTVDEEERYDLFGMRLPHKRET